MKTILLPCRDANAAEAALRIAYRIADHYDSYLEGLFVRRISQVVAANASGMTPAWSALADEGDRLARDARLFGDFMTSRKVPFREVAFTRARVTAGWREIEGHEAQIVGEYGRLFDLIVIGRAADGREAGWLATVETALMQAGRPVLMVPMTSGDALAKRVVVAWNGSTQAARTVALARPLLRIAERVTVLSIEGAMFPGPSADQLADHLIRAGIAADATMVPAQGRAPGVAFLEEARRMEADLLVKGAFTQHRLSQKIFGGATKHILANAEIPVILAH